MPRKKASKEVEPTFEEAITQLEEIVSNMEEEELPLEQLVDQFEQGTKLLNRCQS
ncbi:MAG: exodeoxyribonuclease VII small subunit, partial [Haloferula sp.]